MAKKRKIEDGVQSHLKCYLLHILQLPQELINEVFSHIVWKAVNWIINDWRLNEPELLEGNRIRLYTNGQTVHPHHENKCFQSKSNTVSTNHFTIWYQIRSHTGYTKSNYYTGARWQQLCKFEAESGDLRGDPHDRNQELIIWDELRVNRDLPPGYEMILTKYDIKLRFYHNETLSYYYLYSIEFRKPNFIEHLLRCN